MNIKFLPVAAMLALALHSSAAPLRVPGFTAYLDPETGNGARISSKSGVTSWKDASTKVLWFGAFTNTGSLTARVHLRLQVGLESRLRLSVDGHSAEVTVRGDGTNLLAAEFGSFEITKPGYQKLVLEALTPAAKFFGDIEMLLLDGPAVDNAHFNLKSRRNAASVHLGYPVGKGTNVAAFYCEMTGLDDPVHTYYMACGWHRGYFGMQVNSPTERRIIFSVWDSGGEAIDRKKVSDDNRVKLIAKGDGVYTGDFGNEGTGGHSHLKYPWKTGEKQRFVVTAQPTNETFTIFSGYYFHPEKKQWILISSWRAPKEGGWLRGLYSFSENFVGNNGHLRRKALYGNQWIRTDAGQWVELTTARFTHDSTGKSDRLDRFGGVENGLFFLSHGGFIEGFSKSGDTFTRPATGRLPDITLPLP